MTNIRCCRSKHGNVLDISTRTTATTTTTANNNNYSIIRSTTITTMLGMCPIELPGNDAA